MPTEIQTALALIGTHLEARRFMEARVLARKLIDVAPEDPSGRLSLARAYAAEGKRARAKLELEELLAKWPNCADAERLQRSLEEPSRRGSGG